MDTYVYKKLETVIHIDVNQGRRSADMYVHIHRGHSRTFDSWLAMLTYMYISVEAMVDMFDSLSF